MNKLEAALRWAARGFRVFPLQEASRDPLEMPWTTVATTDPDTIRGWWTCPVTGFERDYNIGCLATEWVILDADVKHNKPGLQTYLTLGFDVGTLTVQTPSGGRHFYHRGLDTPVGQHILGEGLDVRSHNGYVVAPGSTIDGTEYVVETDLPVAEIPAALRGLLRPPHARRDRPPTLLELDTPEALEIARHWLAREAAPAIEGRNGDDTTYRVACRLRDLGVSEEATLELMLAVYNPRCEPPWAPGELENKIVNAWMYATGAPGAAHPNAVFGNIDIPSQSTNSQSSLTQQVNGKHYCFGTLMEANAMTARPWVMGRILLSGEVTELIGVGGAGKSVLMLTIAAHHVVGREWMGHKSLRPGRALVYDGEDRLMEMSRRLHAICAVYGLPLELVRARLALESYDTLDLQVAHGYPPMIETEKVAALVEAASAPDVTLVTVGPLSDIHSTQENDNLAMKYVVRVLRTVAQRAAVAMMVAHHTGKPSAAGNVAAGDPMAGRGASSTSQAARLVLTLFNPTERDCDRAGIAPAERRGYVRLDGAKANFAPGTDPTTWMRWRSVRIQTGDDIGVLVEHDAAAAVDHRIGELARTLRDAMLAGGTASLDLGQATAIVAQHDVMSGLEDPATVRRRLARCFAAGVTVEEHTLRLRSDGRTQVIVIS